MASASIHWVTMDPNWAAASGRENGTGAPNRALLQRRPAASYQIVLRAPATGNGCRHTVPCQASKGVTDLQTGT